MRKADSAFVLCEFALKEKKNNKNAYKRNSLIIPEPEPEPRKPLIESSTAAAAAGSAATAAVVGAAYGLTKLKGRGLRTEESPRKAGGGRLAFGLQRLMQATGLLVSAI